MLVRLFLCAALALSLGAGARAAEVRDLAGAWRFAIDRADEGVRQRWFARDLADRDHIALPGILQAQGYGDEISTTTPWVLSLYDKHWAERADYQPYTAPGQVKVPFLSQPPRHYLGAAWYQRDIEVPPAWRGKRVTLFLERPHWGSTVWLDGREMGANLSLVAAHEYDLGQLAAGRHRLSVRVDNRMLMPYRPDAHSVSDSLGMSWNGIVGKVELRATSPVWLDDAQVFPDPVSKSVLVKIRIGNAGGRAGSGVISANGTPHPVRWDAKGGAAELTVQYPLSAQNWDEFQPVLQTLSLQLRGDGAADARAIRFGFARIVAQGRRFVLNGRTIYLRGTHHGGDFPLTGYPPTDVAYWRRILQINKDWGINHIRFHSFCPPDAAFQAADELGVYLQPEPGMWNEVSPGTDMEQMLYAETDRLIRAYGNHPSFLLLSPSNEPKGRWKPAFDRWIAHYRVADPRRLYSNGTGHTEREVPGLADGADYLVMQRIGAKPLRGNRGWFGGDYGASLNGIDLPVLSHETGQWVAYPDFDVIKKFTGYLRPGNYEIFRDGLARHGMAARDKDFAWASGKFQLENYKEEIEANLRTPGLMGYQLLDLHDYLGQGTALVGLLDTFWEEKGYVTAAAFRRFNGATVPLARLGKRTYTSAERLTVPVEIAHFGAQPLADAQPYWKIVGAAGQVVRSGVFARRTIDIGKNIALGAIDLPLAGLAAPQAYRLVVGLDGGAVENDWRFWLYPDHAAAREPADVLVTSSWEAAETALNAGAKVLYLPRAQDLDWTSPPLDTVPVFWNRLMSPAWGRMLGVWVDQRHPALAQFPSEGYNGWQWNELVNNTRAVNLDRLPPALQPIVQPVDDWNRNYKLGLLFEARVGTGKLMVASPDLVTDLDRRVVARQLRQSVLAYMASAAFAPSTPVDAAAFRRAVLFDTRVMSKLGARASGGTDAAAAIDGDPNTYWSDGKPGAAHGAPALTVVFAQPVAFTGVVLMPRQNHRDHEGDLRDYALQASDDGIAWRELRRGTLPSGYGPQTVDLGRRETARQLRLVSLSGVGADGVSALAELALVYAGPPLPESSGTPNYQRVPSASPDVDENLAPDNKKPAR
ncbi:sugar-binding domain-containing protein [Duganella callida]|uniref:beta-galactosidase n=1 Tax=Duganella callida TaxID=2561932 RepID=A0A4Y9T148_9BURK|nr:sugar-binding domain-containing protein [Duganella callida]TFW31292.1 glycoside hydrolase [Duganella callida]